VLDQPENPGGQSRDDQCRTGTEIVDALVFSSPS
jgi:hypothetical protein